MIEDIARASVVALTALPSVAFLLAAAGVATNAGSRGRVGERSVSKALKRAGFEVLDDALIPTGEGLTQIDHVVRLPGGLAAVETKTWRGTIEYDDPTRDRVWTVKIGQSVEECESPYLQNAHHCAALREAAGAGVPIRNHVVVVGSQGLPNRKHGDPVHPNPSSLVAALQAEAGGAVRAEHDGWAATLAAHRAGRRDRKRHQRQTGEALRRKRAAIHSALFLAAGLASGWAAVLFWQTYAL